MKSRFTIYPAMVILICSMTAMCLKVQATIYTVVNTANTGVGSLRTAITNANASIGLDTIQFNIPLLGQYFESSGLNTWPVIRVGSALPVITDPVLIDGLSQTDLNLGSVPGKTVGVDAYTQASINYPNVYITPATGFSFPNSASIAGNGLTISANNSTVRGICISGFGINNSASGTASAGADIVILRNSTPQTSNININNCFISCDPRGAQPTLAERKTKGDGILVLGYMYSGTIINNYMNYCGTYGIHFNGGIDPLGVGPAGTNVPNQNWLIRENQIINGGSNTATTLATRVGDAVNFMHCQRLLVIYNYIDNAEQVGTDIGYNASDNRIDNNTFTNFTNTTQAAPCVAVRISLNSQRDTIIKNIIYNNSSSTFKAGVWMDMASLPATTGINNTLDNSNSYIALNRIYNNTGSGIVMSTNTVGGPAINAQANTFTQNAIYNNTGLGIDLNYNGYVGPTAVTLNDNTDADAGGNNLQNFPQIDSAKRVGTNLSIWGKGPAGATIEFFTCDGGINKFPAYSLNYGEGKVYLATGVEGSAADLLAGTGTIADVDGNAGTGATASMFKFSFTLSGAQAAAISSIDSLTSTATVGGSTSEFGPQAIKFTILSCDLKDISGIYADNQTLLSWNAVCDNKFNLFEVQYSSDAVHFTALGKVYADVNDNNPKNYSFTHGNPAASSNYYRLKLVDKDGNYKYSNVILIRLKTVAGISISPNPASDNLYININSTRNDVAQVRIINAGGNLVLTRQEHLSVGTNSFTIKDVSHFIPGAYIVQIVTTNDVKSEQVIIRK